MIQRSDTAEMRKYQPEGTTLFLSTNSAEEPIFSRAIKLGRSGIGSFGASGFPHLGNRSTVQSMKNDANPREKVTRPAYMPTSTSSEHDRPAKPVKLFLKRALSALGLAVLLPSLVFRLPAQETTGLATHHDHETAQVLVRENDEVTITESPDLEAWYASDNSRYFGGKLPVVMVGWADMPHALGETFFANGKPEAIAIDRPLGEYSPALTRCVLLHEEAHIARGKEAHDAVFRAKLLKAIKMGGCPALVLQ